MTDNFILVKNKIKTMLESITDLKYVYGYPKGELSGYPVATIYSAEYNPEWVDTTRDKDIYRFTIHLFQEISATGQGAEQAERITDKVLVKIVQKFQTDYILEGLVDKVSISAVKGWTDREVPNRVAVISIITTKLVTI